MPDPFGSANAVFVEPQWNFGYPTNRGFAPGQPSAYKLLYACADDDDKHLDANLELLEHEVKVRRCSPTVAEAMLR